MARLVLDNPPPLTPVALRQFPYAARSFPTSTIVAAVRIVRPAPVLAAVNVNRVE